jgi:hypothetical protein
VLARLWRRPEPEANAESPPLPMPEAPFQEPDPGRQTDAPFHGPDQRTSISLLKRGYKPVTVASLYQEPEDEALAQASILLRLVQQHADDVVGKYVPQSHLERFYGEVCEREGWTVLHWTAIARKLGKLTEKRKLKRRGRRFVGYHIPRP